MTVGFAGGLRLVEGKVIFTRKFCRGLTVEKRKVGDTTVMIFKFYGRISETI